MRVVSSNLIDGGEFCSLSCRHLLILSFGLERSKDRSHVYNHAAPQKGVCRTACARLAQYIYFRTTRDRGGFAGNRPKQT